jgi:hypothetical protein
MCCFLATLMFFGPRLAFLIFWLIPYGQTRVNAAFDGFLLPFLGWLFVPWTTLFYAFLFPIASFDWVILGLAFLADISGYIGGARTRGQVPGYQGP